MPSQEPHQSRGLPSVKGAPAASSGANSFGYSTLQTTDASPTPSWRSCVYFSRGYCKHGSSCRFSHSLSSPSSSQGRHSPNTTVSLAPSDNSSECPTESTRGSEGGLLPQLQMELLDLLYSLNSPVTVASLPQLYLEKYGKNFHPEGSQSEGYGNGRSVTTTLRLLLKLKGMVTVFERPDGQKAVSLKRSALQKMQDPDPSTVDSPSSRQIYLTFPAESTFSEDDVASHFRLFGVVHDVRIPYQQKRMFGFVTFASPNSVKAVLKQGNPHYICGSRVLVKPYRERTKNIARPKCAEALRAVSSEPSDHQRGVFESKLPPRHLVVRAEAKLPYPSRGLHGSSLQGLPVLREGDSQQSQISSPPLPSSPLLPPRKQLITHAHSAKFPTETRQKVQFDRGGDCELQSGYESSDSTCIEAGQQPIAPLSREVGNSIDSCTSKEFIVARTPRMRLFPEYDSEGQESSVTQDIQQKEERASPVEDWNIDIDSILPDSPFSSPQRVVPATNTHQVEPEELFIEEWHPSSAPGGLFPQQEAWAPGESLLYIPPATAAWNPADHFFELRNHTMNGGAPIEDLTQGMALLSMSQMNPFFPAAGHVMPDKLTPATGRSTFCTTCRQRVMVPDSQCACCQQLLCQSTLYLNHHVRDFMPSWQMAVNACIRTSPQ